LQKWKRFERLAAALHALQLQGAQVKWDDEINGYQIDVSARFQNGPYEYLQIHECRDRGRPVTRDDVAVMVNKVKQTKANKGVIISAAGFQSGAKELAVANGIDLFELSEIPADWPEKVIASIPRTSVGLMALVFRRVGDSTWSVMNPARGGQFLTHARFRSRVNSRTTIELLQPAFPHGWEQLDGPFEVQVDLTGEWYLELPPDLKLPVEAVRAQFQVLRAGMQFTARRPEEQTPSTLVYTNVRARSEPCTRVSDCPENGRVRPQREPTIS